MRGAVGNFEGGISLNQNHCKALWHRCDITTRCLIPLKILFYTLPKSPFVVRILETKALLLHRDTITSRLPQVDSMLRRRQQARDRVPGLLRQHRVNYYQRHYGLDTYYSR